MSDVDYTDVDYTKEEERACATNDHGHRIQCSPHYSILAKEKLIDAARQVKPTTGADSDDPVHNHWIGVAAKWATLMTAAIETGAGAIKYTPRSSKALYDQWTAGKWGAHGRHGQPATQPARVQSEVRVAPACCASCK